MDSTQTKKKVFKRLPIWFDERQYKRDLTDANWQMVHLNSALTWCGKYVNTTGFDMVRFQADPVSEFLLHLKEENQDKIQLDLSAHKIADLLEIDMSPIVRDVQQIKKYKSQLQFIYWNNNKKEFQCKLPKENYTKFSRNEEDNEKMLVIQELNDVLGKIAKWKHIYPLNIMQGTSNFVQYNNDTERYILNINQRE